jgi:hypothetical protein
MYFPTTLFLYHIRPDAQQGHPARLQRGSNHEAYSELYVEGFERPRTPLVALFGI